MELIERRREGSNLPAVFADFLLVQSRTLRGRVASVEGNSIEGARVEALGHYFVRDGMSFPDTAAAYTGTDGSYVLIGLRSDIGHTLRVTWEGRGSKEVFVPGLQGLEIDCGTTVLQNDVSFRGCVVDDLGLAVEDVLVEATYALGPARQASELSVSARDAVHSLPYSTRSRTDRQGRFDLSGLHAGEWSVRVWSEGRELLRETVVLAAPNSTETTLRLEAGTPAVQGLVLLGEQPVADVSVELRSNGQRRIVTSDRDGRFRAAGSRPGVTYAVKALWSGPDGELLRGEGQAAAAGSEVVLRISK